MNHLQWGALLQPAINGTYCRIVSIINGHIDRCEAPHCRSWRGAQLLCPCWLQIEVCVCHVVTVVMLYSVLRAQSWANIWSHRMRSAGSVESPDLLLEWSFWCVPSATCQEEFNPALVKAMKSWMTLKVDLQLVVIITLGCHAVQKAYISQRHCARTFFRKSPEHRQEELTDSGAHFTPAENILIVSTIDFACAAQCVVLTSITSILDIRNLTIHILSDEHFGTHTHARRSARNRHGCLSACRHTV